MFEPTKKWDARKEKNAALKRWLNSLDDMTFDAPSLGLHLPVLRAEIRQTWRDDDGYGPLADRIKHSIGLEYEYILHEVCVWMSVCMCACMCACVCACALPHPLLHTRTHTPVHACPTTHTQHTRTHKTQPAN